MLFVLAFPYMPMIVGAISYPIWLSFAFDIGEIERGFYEVTAQVIPVVLLAITIDVRRSRHLESEDLVVTIALLIMGEVVALFNAAGAHTGSLGYASVGAALTVGFVALVMGLIADYEPTNSRSERTRNLEILGSGEPSTGRNTPDISSSDKDQESADHNIT
jgi:hypothetical protein